MVKIKKIGVLSLGKIFGVVYGLMGLIMGVCFAILSLVFGEGALRFVSFGAGAIIILPIIYGVLGFIVGALFATFYNLAVKWVGGIEIETEK